MEVRAKVLPKYQITIPKKVRQNLGLKRGDVLVFEPIPDKKGFLVRKIPPLDALRETLSPLPEGISSEEAVDQAIALATHEDVSK